MSEMLALVGAIGCGSFGKAVAEYLHNICRVEHASIFLQSDRQVAGISAISLDGSSEAAQQVQDYVARGLWKHDPAFAKTGTGASASPRSIVHTGVSRLGDLELRRLYTSKRVIDRIVLRQQSAFGIIGISLLRSESYGTFTPEEIKRLLGTCELDLLGSVVAKHIEVSDRSSDLSRAMSSLQIIEDCITLRVPDLPRREKQVCSRIIYGISSNGIAIDLGIGMETVLTYRKRLYQRLSMGCERELVMWYLRLWCDKPTLVDGGSDVRLVH